MNENNEDHQDDDIGVPINLPLSKYLTPEQADALKQPVPKGSLHKRKGGGNKDFAYVDPRYVTAQLNRIFGFDGWSRETLSCTLIKDEPTTVEQYAPGGSGKTKVSGFCITAQATVRLTIHLTADDGSERKIIRDGVGVSAAAEADKEGQSKGDLMERTIKAAETDALKRAAKTLGKVFGLNIKESDQLEEIPVSPDVATAAPKVAEPARVQRPTVAAPPKVAPKATEAPKAAAEAPKAEATKEESKAETAKAEAVKPEAPAKVEAPKPTDPEPKADADRAVPESSDTEELEPIVVDDNGRSEPFFKVTANEMSKWTSQQWIDHSKGISHFIGTIKTLDDAKLLVPVYDKMKGPAGKDTATTGWHNTLIQRTLARIEQLKNDPETGSESLDYIELSAALAELKIAIKA